MGFYIESLDSNLPQNFFHAEQALRHFVHSQIDCFPKKDILDHFLKNGEDYYILDFCNTYDICWRCADTIKVCSHLKEKYHKHKKLFIRGSALHGYSDTFPNFESRFMLRNFKEEFQGYDNNDDFFTDSYAPYIAQVFVDRSDKCVRN